MGATAFSPHLEAGSLPPRGYFFPPTILTGVHQQWPIVQNEIFGPVITIQKFRSDEEALQLANGLAAEICTMSKK